MSIGERIRGLLPTRFSFGATSAIITNLGLIIGFDSVTNPKSSIIGSILVIAIADNISDTLGMHVYQESQKLTHEEALRSTFSNYAVRLLASLAFVLIVWVLPMRLAVPISLAYGLSVLVLTSYLIARNSGADARQSVLEHVVVASVVIVVSEVLSRFLSRL